MFSLWLVLIFTIKAHCDIQEQIDEAGFHCGGFETNITHANGSVEITKHYHCVMCMFPQNCEADNRCKNGSMGSVCEKCDTGYYRMGNSCYSCPGYPFPVASLFAFLLLFLVTMYCRGLTDSLCTKVKLLCSFLQFVLLTFHIKITWPEILVEWFSKVNFATFNTSILFPECMLQSLPEMVSHYMEWSMALFVPIVTLVIGRIVDKKMSKVVPERPSDLTEDNLPRLKKRTAVRRAVVMIVLVMYMPATLSCIRTFLCSDTIPKLLVLDDTSNVFLLDNDSSCSTILFQTLHFVATFYFMIIGVLMPLFVIFFTLRQKKWNLLYSDWFLYSPVYEAFEERYCFWEAVPLLRKLVGIIITEAYPFSDLLQTSVQLGLTGLYLQAVVALKPFRYLLVKVMLGGTLIGSLSVKTLEDKYYYNHAGREDFFNEYFKRRNELSTLQEETSWTRHSIPRESKPD